MRWNALLYVKSRLCRLQSHGPDMPSRLTADLIRWLLEAAVS